MKEDYKNKAMGEEKITYKLIKRSYNFPKYDISFMSVSTDDANAQLKAYLKEKNNKSNNREMKGKLNNE